jgi:hypothetical protein
LTDGDLADVHRPLGQRDCVVSRNITDGRTRVFARTETRRNVTVSPWLEGEGLMGEHPKRHARVVGTSIATAFLLAMLGLPATSAQAATVSSPITYVYDDIGRLEAVIDASQTNGLAK